MSNQDKSIHDKKNKSIAEAIRAIHKQFGSGSIMRLDGSEVQPVEVIPTGSVALDVALGCGGLPRGLTWTALPVGIAERLSGHALADSGGARCSGPESRWRRLQRFSCLFLHGKARRCRPWPCLA